MNIKFPNTYYMPIKIVGKIAYFYRIFVSHLKKKYGMACCIRVGHFKNIFHVILYSLKKN